jgi:hypothetical protein
VGFEATVGLRVDERGDVDRLMRTIEDLEGG